ncbi:unnamed protein product, partial [Durusdinium trenchii]
MKYQLEVRAAGAETCGIQVQKLERSGEKVQILAAEGLRNADWLSSGSDPYCLVTVGCSVGLTVRCMVVVV